MKLNWVELRYRTKRGAKQKVRLVDVDDNVARTVASLESTGCHSFDKKELA